MVFSRSYLILSRLCREKLVCAALYVTEESIRRFGYKSRTAVKRFLLRESAVAPSSVERRHLEVTE